VETNLTERLKFWDRCNKHDTVIPHLCQKNGYSVWKELVTTDRPANILCRPVFTCQEKKCTNILYPWLVVGGLLFKMVIQTCTNNKPSNHNASVMHLYARKTLIIRNIYRFTPAALPFIWLHLRYQSQTDVKDTINMSVVQPTNLSVDVSRVFRL